MKKILLGALIISIITGIAVTSATSSTTTTTTKEDRGYVMANGSANKDLTPDTAQISFSVVTYDKTSMQKASDENKEITEKIIKDLKGFINTANNDYIKTTNYSATQQYKYQNRERVFDKYEVSNTIIINTKNIDKVGNMIDKAIKLGATDVDNLNFTVSKYDKDCEEILAEATKKAKSQAEIMAKAVGSELDGIKTLSGSCNSSGAPRHYRYATNKMMMADAAVAESAGPSTPIEVGTIKLYANVDANFFVK